MIVAFDLDDTLYDESAYVRSGFRAVARALASGHGVDEDVAFEVMLASLATRGRGTQFDDVLAHFGLLSRSRIKELVRVYRDHGPEIELPRESRDVLDALSEHRLYLVTDGHKGVQAKKVEALGIAPLFEHCYLTNRYGEQHQKPSPHVFELMIKRERCQPEDVVYIGDNPRKDFRGIRPLGFRTIRVRQGGHAGVEVPAEQDAERCVRRLSDVLAIIEQWEAAACQA